LAVWDEPVEGHIKGILPARRWRGGMKFIRFSVYRVGPRKTNLVKLSPRAQYP